jgi:glutamate:GABA antiporter
MSANTAEVHLSRPLGLGDVVLYFVTACSSLQWVATAAAAGPSSLIVWIVAGFAMFLPVSVCTVALAARYPDEGGMYVWSKLAFGPFAGFLTGWTYWTSNLPYFAGMLYFAAGSALWISGGGTHGFAASPAWFIGFAVFGLGFATVLNIFGLGVSKWLNNAGAIARCAALLLLIGLGAVAWHRYGSATTIDAASLRPGLGLNDLIFWASIAFAMTGPESASFMGGEIRDARRTVPRALLRAAPLILAIYIGGTLAVLVSVPWQQTSAMYGVMEAVDRVGGRLGLVWLTPLAAVLIVITCLGSAGAWLGSVARIPFVAGLDHFLPSSFGRLHPRYGSPANALMVQTAIAMIFAVMGQAGTSVKGAYDVLVSLMVIGLMLPYLFLFTAAIRLSGGEPVPDQLRIPGGRCTIVATALVGLATTVAAIILAVVPRPDEPNKMLAVIKIVGMTAAMLGIGVAIYVGGKRRARRAARPAAAVIS